jgi:hypothetical protein
LLRKQALRRPDLLLQRARQLLAQAVVHFLSLVLPVPMPQGSKSFPASLRRPPSRACRC